MCAFWSHADGQPVGGQRRGQRAAGDEAEVARAGAGDDAGVGGRDQLVDHLLGGHALVGQLVAERGAQRVGVDRAARRGGSGSEARKASAWRRARSSMASTIGG